jgi:hypothetical protein
MKGSRKMFSNTLVNAPVFDTQSFVVPVHEIKRSQFLT